MKPKIICISAKCSDMFSARLRDESGRKMGEDYSGYVPDFMPGEHYGDYVELEIDLMRGQILNWTTPTQEQLKKIFGDLKTPETC